MYGVIFRLSKNKYPIMDVRPRFERQVYASIRKGNKEMAAVTGKIATALRNIISGLYSNVQGAKSPQKYIARSSAQGHVVRLHTEYPQ
jgi:hypothetical protein